MLTRFMLISASAKTDIMSAAASHAAKKKWTSDLHQPLRASVTMIPRTLSPKPKK
jgi:hypothetical protein